ncbi:MAG: MFS transporter [bacterium]
MLSCAAMTATDELDDRSGFRSPYLRYALAINNAGMMVLSLAINLTPVFLTTFGRELGGPAGLTNEQLGRIGGVTFLGLVLGILISSPLADRAGPKPFAVLGNLMIGAGLLLLGTAHSYAQVLTASLIMGCGAGVLDMVLSPIVCALLPDGKTAAMNWLHSYYCSGAVLSILIGSLALRLALGWRTVTLCLALPCLLVALAFVRLRLPPLVAQTDQRQRLRKLARRPFFLVALVTIFLGGATELSMAQWLPAYAERQLGFSALTGGMAFLFFSVAMAAGRIVAGQFGRRLDAYRLLLACCWFTVALFLLACATWWPYLALGACVAAGLSGSCLWPSMLGILADAYPRGGASMFGMLAACGNLGGVFMPWAVGAIADRASLATGLTVSAACPIGMAMLLLWMRRRDASEKRLS